MTDADVRILTPEQVSLEFTLAGIGSRALAQLIDIVLLLLALGLVITGLVFWHTLHVFRGATSYVIGVTILTSFLAFWAYFILLEYFWSGRTIGKRLVHIRVVGRDGRPISFFAAAIRNFLRVIDILPTGYFLGVVTMLVDKKERRIGDLAAGTLVVVDRPLWQLQPLAPIRDVHQAEEQAEVIQVPISRSSGVVVITGPLPREWVAWLVQVQQRSKGMSKDARNALARRIWSQLHAFENVRIDGLSNEVSLTDKQLVETISAIVRALRTKSTGDVD